MPSVSNEADEIHRMLNCLNNVPQGQSGSTSTTLATYFGVNHDGPEYFIFISAIQLRFDRFGDVLRTAIRNDRHLGNVLAAIDRVRKFTSYHYWQAGWTDAKRAIFLQADLDLIEGTGFGLAHIAPVIYLDSSERRGQIDQLRRKLEEIDLSDDYLTDMVRMSLTTAIKMLDRFEIFGSSIVGEKLIEALALVKHAAEEPAQRPYRDKLLILASTIGVVLSSIVLADDVPTALSNHYTRFQSGTIFLPETGAQNLLPPPSSFNDN